MNKKIVYFSPASETGNIRRKHLVFLEKSGFFLHRSASIKDFAVYLEEKPLAVILTDEAFVQEITETSSTIPIILLLHQSKDTVEILNKYGEVSNVIFCRYETDPIDTVLE